MMKTSASAKDSSMPSWAECWVEHAPVMSYQQQNLFARQRIDVEIENDVRSASRGASKPSKVQGFDTTWDSCIYKWLISF